MESKIMKILKASDRTFGSDIKADVGIGVLIVFIAMVMVSAIAASVLMQTANSLSGKTKAVVSEVSKDLTNGLWINEIYGYTNEAKSQIEYLGIVTKLAPGSQDMDLLSTKVVVQGDDLLMLAFDNITYGDTIGNAVGSYNAFDVINLSNVTAQNFGIISLQDSDNSIVFVGGMGRDDRAMLILNLSAIFSGNVPREGITIELTPPFGQSVTQEIMFPTSMDNRVVDLSH